MEAVIYAIKDSFMSDNIEDDLLIDASNIYNPFNQQAALHNTMHLYSLTATIYINTYRNTTDIFIDDSAILY